MADIDWARLDQRRFDRIVEALYMAENGDLGQDAYAVNGRGGDGGIDILIRRDGRLTIAQLKYFPEGFSGGFAKARRAEIRRSFESALRHGPDVWQLVVPNTATVQERTWVTGLSKGRKPKIEIVDRSHLDGLAANHQDLVTFFQRDSLLYAAETYGQEKAILTEPSDLVARVAALGRQADTLDPDWRLDFFRRGDVTISELVPKHSQAAIRSPISINVHLKIPSNDKALQNSIDRVLGFGVPERLDLPAPVVASFAIDGPAFLRRESEYGDLTFLPEMHGAGHLFTYSFMDDQGRVRAAFDGTTAWTGAASRGVSVKAEFFGLITIEFQIPDNIQTPGGFRIDLDALDGHRPADVLQALDLIDFLQQGGDAELTIGGKRLARFRSEPQPGILFGNKPDVLDQMRLLADDLDYVQRQTHQSFGFPAQVSMPDRAYLRAMRLVLEGACVVFPWANHVSLELSGLDSPEIRDQLGREQVTMLFEVAEFGFHIFDRDLTVGTVRVYAPNVQIPERLEALQALDRGEAAGKTITVQTVDDHSFWIFMPDRLRVTEDQVLRPIGLGLPEIPDPADARRSA